MKTLILFFIFTICDIHGQYARTSPHILVRNKRDASGALEILTNNVQPIHADVKNDNGAVEKPCPKTYIGNLPSNIELRTVFQVIPPKDTIYKGKSLRKSLQATTGLNLVRAISRVVTLVALLFSAVLEFYPLVQNLYFTVYEFMNPNKF